MSGDAAEIRRSGWMGLETQAPAPMVEIFTSGNKDKADITYRADSRDRAYSKLLAYSFSEAVDDLSGSFSISVEDEEADAEGATVFDLIPPLSVVKIYETDGGPARFVGVIRRRRLGAAMTSQGMKRAVTFSGKSVASLVAELTLSLDARIPNVRNAMTLGVHLTDRLARQSPLSIKEFMKETWKHFMETASGTSEQGTGIAAVGLSEVIGKFMGEDFIRVEGDENLKYDVAMTFYVAANNVIDDTWRNILPDRAYEIFTRCEDGVPIIVARESPFGSPESGYREWLALPLYEISPISLVEYSLERSDDEVYTAFASYVIGSSKDRSFYTGAGQIGSDELVAHDREKQALYGFRPLEINFNGYDRQGNTGNAEIQRLTDAIRGLNEKTRYWYSRLDEMHAGQAVIVTDHSEPDSNPRAGCRVKFMGGQFYVTRTERSWTYGGAPVTRIDIERGMTYGRDGSMGAPLRRLGARRRELERDG
ncbi:MAG: hypothetical protein FWE09_00415 [Treponema sp.]|nr:hypothetical protein [Treponema sp.]